MEFAFDPKELIFDEKVREQCKSCKRYGTRYSCPPYVESVEFYKRLMQGYQQGLLIALEFVVGPDWKEDGKKSSVALANKVLEVRERLIAEGHYFAVGFGAGSCKNCVECADPCRLPNKALLPVEATGVNVVESFKEFIQIQFPVRDTFYRIGVVLYQ